MSAVREQPGSAVLAAMACSGAITAQFIAGKAARDAFYLAQFDVTSLPIMVMATSVTSIGIAVLGAQLLRRIPTRAARHRSACGGVRIPPARGARHRR